MKKTVSLILLSLLPCWILTGQGLSSDTHYYCFTAKGCYGFIADVKNRNHLLVNNHITPLEISFRQPVPARYSWQMLLPGAEKGISLKHINLRNPDNLGSIWVLAPFITVPVMFRRPWRLSLYASMGMVYAEKIYHRTENYRNTMFGSHLNGAFGFGMENSFYLFNSFIASAGFDFFHYSNGETTLPNDGINIGNVFFSAGYQFHNNMISVSLKNSEFRKKGHVSIIPVFGWKDLSPVKSRRYYTAALSAEYFYTLTRIQNIGGGIALFYDNSVSQLYENDIEKGDETSNPYRQVTSGLYMIYEFNLCPVVIHFQAGYYILDDRIDSRSRIFNRFGLRYHISERYFINITHKSHFFFKGDNLEWGIGYIIC
ncbi:MAG: acyloxyacyl hydrolase [Bacteroidales bacterium]|nr:acyloxyacyl hydrolase [Bacteroidales bacterium]